MMSRGASQRHLLAAEPCSMLLDGVGMHPPAAEQLVMDVVPIIRRNLRRIEAAFLEIVDDEKRRLDLPGAVQAEQNLGTRQHAGNADQVVARRAGAQHIEPPQLAAVRAVAPADVAEYG